MNITGFLIMNSAGDEIEADAFGSHLAFCCEACAHPVLANAATDQRGSDIEHPVECPGCGQPYFLDVRPHAKKLYIHDPTLKF